MNSKDISKFHTLLSTSTVSHHHHPSIWKVIVWFQKKYATEQVALVRLQRNASRRVWSVCIYVRLQTLCRDQASWAKDLKDFLAAIGENIRLYRGQHLLQLRHYSLCIMNQYSFFCHVNSVL